MRPPETSRIFPLTSEESADTSHATRGEMFAGSIASNPSSGAFIMSANTPSVMRVRAAGAIALEVTPYPPSSAACTSVSPAMPAFAAE